MSDTYAAETFARCNIDSDTSTEAAIAKAVVDFNTCRLEARTNGSSCTADRTVTMLVAHARIAVVRTACSACAYPLAPSSARPEPPSARFNIGAEATYTAAADIFDAATITRCNAAAVDASVAAGEEIGGSLLAAVQPGLCEARTACIVAGDPPAPAIPRARPSEYSTYATLNEFDDMRDNCLGFDLPAYSIGLSSLLCRSEPSTELNVFMNDRLRYPRFNLPLPSPSSRLPCCFRYLRR